MHRVRDLFEVDITRPAHPRHHPGSDAARHRSTVSAAGLEEALDGACRRTRSTCRSSGGASRAPRRRPARRRGPRRPAPSAGTAPQRGELAGVDVPATAERAGLPLPRIQVSVVSGPGGKRYRLDGTYDEHDLVVEVDGHATHATRRQRQADAERDARLLAAGRRVVRFTYEDLVERPALRRRHARWPSSTSRPRTRCFCERFSGPSRAARPRHRTAPRRCVL